MKILLSLIASASLCFGGIADRYPGDVGIETDPAVILFDGFETYTSPSQLGTKWSGHGPDSMLRISTAAGTYFRGRKGLEMQLPVLNAERSIRVERFIFPEEPVLFVRCYMKWENQYSLSGSAHNGIRISGNFPQAGQKAPRNGTGWFLFLLDNNEAGMAGEGQPGYGNVYAYWPFQRDNYGDHWYSDGWVRPGGWGLWVRYPAQYPDFVAMPNWQPTRGVWYCFEVMVKINTLGQNNGEVAWWVNGQLKGRWPNLFIRSTTALQIDDVVLNLHAHNSTRINKKWHDNVVIAREYIGPIAP